MGDSTSPRTVVVYIYTYIHFLYDLNPYSMYGEAQKYQKESVGFLCKLQVLLQLDESFAESTLKLSSRISHSTYHPMASNDRHNLFLMALNFQKILPKMSFLASTSTTIELYQSLAEKCNLVGIRLSTCGELMCRKSQQTEDHGFLLQRLAASRGASRYSGDSLWSVLQGLGSFGSQFKLAGPKR